MKNFFLQLDKFHWRRIYVLIITSAVLALPWPVYKVIGNLSNTDVKAEIRSIELPISAQPISSTVLTHFTGIKLISMPTRVCLKNNNKVLLDGVEKKSSELLDSREGAAMSFEISYPNDGINKTLYARMGAKDCHELDSKYDYATTTNIAEVRNVFPAEAPFLETSAEGYVVKAKLAAQSKVDISRSKIVQIIDFKIAVYLKNMLLVFIGLIILCATIIQVYPYLRK